MELTLDLSRTAYSRRISTSSGAHEILREYTQDDDSEGVTTNERYTQASKEFLPGTISSATVNSIGARVAQLDRALVS
jgi:hypothetical protein